MKIKRILKEIKKYNEDFTVIFKHESLTDGFEEANMSIGNGRYRYIKNKQFIDMLEEVSNKSDFVFFNNLKVINVYCKEMFYQYYPAEGWCNGGWDTWNSITDDAGPEGGYKNPAYYVVLVLGESK